MSYTLPKNCGSPLLPESGSPVSLTLKRLFWDKNDFLKKYLTNFKYFLIFYIILLREKSQTSEVDKISKKMYNNRVKWQGGQIRRGHLTLKSQTSEVDIKSEI